MSPSPYDGEENELSHSAPRLPVAHLPGPCTDSRFFTAAGDFTHHYTVNGFESGP